MKINNKEILDKILFEINDLVFEKSIDLKNIMIIFRKRNVIISDLIKILRDKNIKIYSKNYISFEPTHIYIKNFILFIDFIFDYKNEYKKFIILQKKIIYSEQIISFLLDFFLNNNFEDFLEYIIILSFNKLINFDYEFLKYILKIFCLYRKSQNIFSSNNNIFDFIEYIKKNEIQISDSEQNTWDYNSIRILTIHASKGLESDYVIFYDDFSDFKEKKELNRSMYKDNEIINIDFNFSILDQKITNHEYNDLFSDNDKLLSNKKIGSDPEEKRLLYVALTRAKKKLIIVSANLDIYNKYMKIQDLM
jgi:ATP-dependent exoDNAse (exonuclease V) beta subunit